MNVGLNELKTKLENCSLKIAVIGLGRIGLPTAVAVSRSGLLTKGVDINPSIVESVNAGKLRVDDEPGLQDELSKVIQSKKLSATTEISEAVNDADVIIVCLPTPLDNKTKTVNYSYLLDGSMNIAKNLQKGSLVIIESTVGPGVVEDEIVPVIEKQSGMKAGIDFGIVSCPERANPSTILSDFNKIPRVVGGINQKSSDLATKLYEFIFNTKIITVQNCKTANAVKVVENVFRDVNVAFMNEIAIFCDKIGIDVMELIEGCKTKYNFIPHYPGAGVGGPCLPVNPYQLLDAPEAKGILNVIRTAREINIKMPYYVIELVKNALNEIGKNPENSSITILGVSYKPNVGDVQLSPIETIVNELNMLGCKIKLFDPFFKGSTVFSLKVEDDLEQAVKDTDLVIIGTAHDEFLNLDLRRLKELMIKPCIVDTRGIISPKKSKELGFVYKGVGRSSSTSD